MQTIFLGVHGSHLYGLNTPESDWDYKGIFIPSVPDMIMGTGKQIINHSTGNDSSKNSKDDIDTEMLSLQKFINLACSGEPYVMDMLHTTPEWTLQSSPVWEYIQRNRDKFYCTNMKAYLGYVMKQASKYGVKGSRLSALREVMHAMTTIPDNKLESLGEGIRGVKSVPARLREPNNLPTNEFCFWEYAGEQKMYYVVLGRKYMPGIKVSEFRVAVKKLWNEYGERARKAEQNNNIDWKALSHALRGGMQLKEIYTNGTITYPLKDKPVILAVKRGKLPFAEVQELLEHTVHDVESLVAQAKKNGMRAAPDKEFWDSFVKDVYMDTVENYFRK